MPVRILTGHDVARLLPMEACIAAMEDVLTSLARGQAIQPLRTILRLPEGKGAFGVMPGQVSKPDCFGLKVITVFPGNEGTRYDSHQGAVLLFEPQYGTLVAIMDAASVTAIRTAAVSGVATRLLAREDARDLAILGSGVQARTHLEAVRAVRPLQRVRVWSRSAANARAFAEWAEQRFGQAVEPIETARDAVAGADIICTVTSARVPVLSGDWLAPGSHVNAVGSSNPVARELDADAVRRSRMFVDRRESALAEAGDFLLARQEGAVTDDHILGEIGELLVGTRKGRETNAEITLFKSLGLAVEDVASAHVVWNEAERRNAGTLVELGGLREP
jgi:ornithine cyclodeaminase